MPPSKHSASGPLETLEGVLERVTYANEESGWSVVKVEVPRRAGLTTVVGNLLGVQPGESLRLTGHWVTDKKYGEQFQVESYLTVTPGTLVGLEKYLGSGLVQGIGKVMAERLVKRFGLETLDVIENQSSRLLHVDGIGPKRKAKIVAAWAEHKSIKEVMLFLQTHGVSPTYAIKICKTYGPRAIAVVKANPYQLAADIFGIGFKSADRIAKNIGIVHDSPDRARAGVLHVLEHAADVGHVFLPHEVLLVEAAQTLEVDSAILAPAIESLEACGRVVVDPSSTGDAVYLTALFHAEKGAAEKLASLVAAAPPPLSIHLERAIEWTEHAVGFALAEQQRRAVRDALLCKVLVITGGPGTGKTTIVNAILQIFKRKEQRVLLCAPTGRAAKRLSESTGESASTIHRLLDFDPKRGVFEKNGDNPLAADLLVVDEVSMVDTPLCNSLLRALPESCRLVLVGDVDQLPSVGPGSVLAEIIRSKVVPVVRLTEIFRQAQASLIVQNAHRINQGEAPSDGREVEDADFYFVEREEPEAVIAAIKELLTTRIPRRFHLDPIRDVQVLTPMHKGVLGSRNLNDELQALLNPHGKELARGSRRYRIGDKVMQLRNNYTLEVQNGDIGRIHGFDEEEQTLTVTVDDRLVTYEFADLDELTLGYACSVHKSQGSEYPAVILPLHTQHFTMLQRNLLYTAVTRGRKLVVLVGTKRALHIALRNSQVSVRHTRLAARLAAR